MANVTILQCFQDDSWETEVLGIPPEPFPQAVWGKWPSGLAWSTALGSSWARI